MKHSLTGICSKLCLGAGLALALVLTATQQAVARPTTGWVSTTIEGGSANLRSGPSLSNPVQTTARNGSRFQILNEQFDSVGYRWYQVRPDSVTLASAVWVRSDLVSFTAPFAAQPRIDCASATNETITRITAVPGTVFSTRAPTPHGYTDGPTAKPNGISYVLDGSGAANILASPVFMNSLATLQIENCPQVGLVTFSEGTVDAFSTDLENLSDSDASFINYGAMPGRLVRPFQCKVGPGSDRGPARWGEMICL